MIKEGEQHKARHRGEFEIKKVIRLEHPVLLPHDDREEVLFNPTLAKIHWKSRPDNEDEFWFPHWITTKGKERFAGQNAPMMDEDSLFELLQEAIRREFFSDNFLYQLHKTITDKLNSKKESA